MPRGSTMMDSNLASCSSARAYKSGVRIHVIYNVIKEMTYSGIVVCEEEGDGGVVNHVAEQHRREQGLQRLEEQQLNIFISLQQNDEQGKRATEQQSKQHTRSVKGSLTGSVVFACVSDDRSVSKQAAARSGAVDVAVLDEDDEERENVILFMSSIMSKSKLSSGWVDVDLAKAKKSSSECADAEVPTKHRTAAINTYMRQNQAKLAEVNMRATFIVAEPLISIQTGKMARKSDA